MKISVIIHTYNAGKTLEQVLISAKGFDEIVICDMYSQDNTLALAQQYACNIMMHEHTGIAEPARNSAIHFATHPWVLVADADELIPEALREYLYNFIQHPTAQGLYIPRKNFFMGRFMHASYPDHILRFFQKEGSYWPPYVHSMPTVVGKSIKIPAAKKDLAFVHLDDGSISERLNKFNIYTDKELIRPKHNQKKYSIIALIFKSLHRFIQCYIFKGGFRDGREGFVYASLFSFYKFLTIAKSWETKK